MSYIYFGSEILPTYPAQFVCEKRVNKKSKKITSELSEQMFAWSEQTSQSSD